MLFVLYDELRTEGVSLKLAEATGDCRDSIKKAGLDSQFGRTGRRISVRRSSTTGRSSKEEKAHAGP